MPEPPAEEAPAEEEGPGGLSFSAFADAHYAIQTGKPGAGIPGFRAYAGASPSAATGGYVNDNGFALNFAGLDAAYDGGELGATLSLRFGPKVPNYHFNSPNPGLFGIENVTQAYATWVASDSVTIDMGMFGTIFGAEVLESWQNLNYTRGALYFAAQPFWHTGVRAGFALSDMVSLTALIVNDANTTWSSDVPTANAPVGALQLGISPSDDLSIAFGGMVAIDDETASGLETFFDLVVSYSADDFTAILNADYNLNRNEDTSIYGVSLALGYQFTPIVGAAIRGEFVGFDDNDDATDDEPTITATATLDFKPVEDSSNLIIRVEGRADMLKDGFVEAGTGGIDDMGIVTGDPTDMNLMGVVSMVVTTN